MSARRRPTVACPDLPTTAEREEIRALRAEVFELRRANEILKSATQRFGAVERAVAAGLALRYDGGPSFRSEHYQMEIDSLGIARSPAYHYEPETNGCVERFMGTLKEQVLWIERFDTHAALRVRVREFARTYNESWLLRTPRLPHTRRGTRAPTPPGARDMITMFTTEVSGEPGPGQRQRAGVDGVPPQVTHPACR